MTKSDSNHPPDGPTFIKCGARMRLSCIELEKPGFEHRVYECTRCRSTQSFVTANTIPE